MKRDNNFIINYYYIIIIKITNQYYVHHNYIIIISITNNYYYFLYIVNHLVYALVVSLLIIEEMKDGVVKNIIKHIVLVI